MTVSKKKNYKYKMKPYFDPMAVTWLENYNDIVTKIWNRIPYSIGKCFATVSIFMIGISINGKFSYT